MLTNLFRAFAARMCNNVARHVSDVKYRHARDFGGNAIFFTPYISNDKLYYLNV